MFDTLFQKKIYLGLYFGLIVLLVFAFYSPFIDDFFYKDDFTWLENAQISAKNITHITTLNISHFFRPLAHLFILFEYFLFGLHPAGYHVVSILLHALNGILAFFFIRDVLKIKNTFILTLAPILFSTHFVFFEAVGWISAQENLLLFGFFLLTMLFLAKRKFTLFLIFFILALFTKEESVSLFPIIAAYLFIAEKTPFTRLFKIREFVFSGILWLIYVIGQILVQRNSPLIAEQTFSPGFDGILTLLERIFILFFDLQPPVNFLMATFILVLISTFFFYQHERNMSKEGLLFLLFFVIFTLLPTSFFSYEHASRYFYIPTFPSIILLTLLFASLFEIPRFGKFIAPFLAILFIAMHYSVILQPFALTEQLGKESKNVIEQIKPSVTTYNDRTFNFIQAPLARPHLFSLMKLYFGVPPERIVFDQPQSEDYVNLSWEAP